MSSISQYTLIMEYKHRSDWTTSLSQWSMLVIDAFIPKMVA